MLSSEQLVSLITALGFSTGDLEDKPGVDPIWPGVDRQDQMDMIRNFAINVLEDMTKSGEPGFGGVRGPGIRSPFPTLGDFNDHLYKRIMEYFSNRQRERMHAYAEVVDRDLAELHSRICIVGGPSSDHIQLGNSRYYQLDYKLAESLQRNLQGRFPFVEFSKKVGGTVSIRFLARGQELPDVWENVMQFVIYLIRSYKHCVAVGNAPTPDSEPAEAISEQVRNLIAKVPVDGRYEAIHKFGQKLIKELKLRGL